MTPAIWRRPIMPRRQRFSAGIRVDEPGQLAAALKQAISLKGPTVVDVVVTRDPAKMLPGVDSRSAAIRKGDRVA